MADNQGKGSGRGNFGNRKQHQEAGSMSSGNQGNTEQHREAGKLGAEAQPIEAKREGGRKSRGGGNRGNNNQ
jgi:uncharacterized protein